jgi:hypothetical protein
MDPVQDPLLLRKCGSSGNRTRNLWICSQELRPLDHRGGHKNDVPLKSLIFIWSLHDCVRWHGNACDRKIRLDGEKFQAVPDMLELMSTC